MNDKEIALQVASDLTPQLTEQFGERFKALCDKTEETIKNPPVETAAPRRQATRGLFETVHFVAEVGTVAHFIWTVTPHMLEGWKKLRDAIEVANIGKRIGEEKGFYKILSPEIARQIIEAVKQRITANE